MEIKHGWVTLTTKEEDWEILDHFRDAVEPHDGERFSGWQTFYEISHVGWLFGAMDYIGAIEGLGPRRQDNGTWLNVIRGKGAEIEEHTEGRSPEDWTVCLFLCNLMEGEGGLLVIGNKEFQPIVGQYVAFPSTTPHRVTKMLTDAPRLSAAALFEGANG